MTQEADNMVNISFSNDVVAVTLSNREILFRYDEFHSLSEAYIRFYAKESVAAYLKKHQREDLTDCMDEIVEHIYKDMKYMLDDNETIAAAILAIAVETI